jgi:hypothetical protein
MDMRMLRLEDARDRIVHRRRAAQAKRAAAAKRTMREDHPAVPMLALALCEGLRDRPASWTAAARDVLARLEAAGFEVVRREGRNG